MEEELPLDKEKQVYLRRGINVELHLKELEKQPKS